jgi:SynChlorMet cassette protein ScmD
MISPQAKPIANPKMVLREEFDDWAILFDPDTADTYGLNPVCVFIWKRLDGRRTIDEILAELRQACRNVPPEADQHLEAFVADLLSKGLAGVEYRQA